MQKISTLWPHLAPFWPYLAPFGQCGPCAHVFASCARVRARIFTKIFVWVFYYHISLSFKFHTDPSFCCGDIFLTQGTLRYQFVKVTLLSYSTTPKTGPVDLIRSLGSVHILRNHVRGGWGVQAHLITLIMPWGGGGGVSIKMIMYYMIISAQLIFKVIREKSSCNELDVTYNNQKLFNLCCPSNHKPLHTPWKCQNFKIFLSL